MNKSEQQEFIDLLGATLEIYNTKLTPAAISIWVAALSKYGLSELRGALSRHVQTPGQGKFAPKPADIIELLQGSDGRLGADEAWSLIPRNEYTSAVMTQEMATALGVAQPLLDSGDQVGARMAFKEAYARVVDENRRLGIKPQWFPSLGWDKTGREAVLLEAVRLGRLGSAHVAGLLPPAPASERMLQIVKKVNLRGEQ